MLVELFEEQVEKHPHKIAIRAASGFITYKELNRQANRVARLIQKRTPAAGKSNQVGLLFDHGPDMIAAILGTLKAGKVYVPLAPTHPPRRIAYMLTDSQSFLLLAPRHYQDLSRELAHAAGIDVVIPGRETGPQPENNPQRQIKTNPLAYIMYTSGSTGKPKGVMQTHENVLYYTQNWVRVFSITASDRMTLFSSFCHDGSVQDLFSALLSGAILYPYDMRQREESIELSGFLTRERITIWHSVPSLYGYFANTLTGTRQFRDLRFILLGGEPIRAYEITLLKKFFPHSTLACVYGQTESSVDAILLVTQEDSYQQMLIGQPLEKTQIFVIDEQGNPVEPLETGEILVVCPHVSPGYWNNSEATAAAFGEEEGFGKLYWTGDLGCLLPDGGIEFLGRKDFQVKIRGYRVEPGEIESRLLKHPQIKEAVVTAREDETGGKDLCAYFTSDSNVPGLSPPLREFLSLELPDYMIPAYFIRMETFPLTQSGKIDRQALPPPQIKKKEGYTAPRDFIEEQLAETWARVLALEKELIGIDGNFFELGGHSLKATALVSRLHRLANVKISLVQVFKTPTIRGLSAYIRGSVKDRYKSIQPTEKKEYYGLSSAQKRLYFLQRMQAHSTAYNMPRTVPFTSALPLETLGEKLETLFNKLIARHESLRTSFAMIHDQPVQEVHRNVDFKIQTLDIVNPSSVVRPFNLSAAPLLRVKLIKQADSNYFLNIDMHHIITDGTSQLLLIDEFQSLYQGNHHPSLRLQYKDYAQWQNSKEQQALLTHQQAYWLKVFAAPAGIPVLDLPMDRPRPLTRSYEGGTVTFSFTPPESQTLKRLAKEVDGTPFMIILALWNILLAKLSSREDIVIGTPIAARRHHDLESIIGMFVNTLALRNNPCGEKPCRQFLAEVKQGTLEAFENQEYQFEDLVEKLTLPRDTARNPLFDVVINLLNLRDYHDLHHPGEPGKENPGPPSYLHRKGTAKFDLTLNVLEREDTFFFLLEYDAILFEPGSIDRFIRYYRKILAALQENPQQKISQLEILHPEEKQQILNRFNDTFSEYPRDNTIPQCFARQARQTPDHVALTGPINAGGDHISISYRRLNGQAHRLAGFLREKGVAADTIAAFMIDTSVEMVIGILGILQAGGAYLPIDPENPENRVKYLLADSNAKVLLTRQEIALPPGIDLPSSPLPHFPTSRSSSLAYIIYTSGSTGKPKGVMVNHYSVLRLVKNTNFLAFEPRDKLLQTGALNFDASTFETWGSLLNGLNLCLISKQNLVNPLQLKTAIRQWGVTLMWMTSPLFNRMLQEDIEIFQGLKTLLVGGDILSPPHIRQLKEAYPRLNVINGYGPTENTTFSTTHPVELPVTDRIPIGKPIANSTAYILDRYHNLVPVGVPGELAVGGDGLARGYLNNPELTAEKFCLRRPGERFLKKLPPWTPRKNFFLNHSPLTTHHSTIYLTGDLARWLPDGTIEFLGRRDFQVKIRGIRVELGEIRKCLLAHPGIKEAVVLDRTDASDEKYLCAYIVSAEPIKDLPQYLSRWLPNGMIPSYFVSLAQIPLTPGGKINRDALPGPGSEERKNDLTPTDTLEKKLLEIWAEILGRDRLHQSQLLTSIGPHDNFFQIGGHSLKATTLISRIKRQLKLDIGLIDVFNHPTLRRLAGHIKVRRKEIHRVTSPQLVLLKEEKDNTNHLFFIHDGSGDVEAYLELCGLLDTHPGHNYWGIKADEFDGYAPKILNIKDLARSYLEMIKEVQPSGPYRLAGWSLGGIVAFEIVARLEQAKETVDFFAMIDTRPPGNNSTKPLGKFTLESELDWIKNYLPGGLQQDLRNACDTRQMWAMVVDNLETFGIDREKINRFIAGYEGQLMRNYNHLNSGETLRYLNIIRSFEWAYRSYSPPGKMNAPLYYFNASQSKQTNHKKWQEYCRQPVQFYEVSGDHYSILKFPQVIEFAKKFSNIMNRNKKN